MFFLKGRQPLISSPEMKGLLFFQYHAADEFYLT
jgi:hypothetical protein